MRDSIVNGKMKYALVVFGIVSFFIQQNIYAQANNYEKHSRMNDSTMMKRQEMIHSNSHLVMPFDMNKVTHYFVKTSNGGVLMIKAKDAKDSSQISLIRSHLKKEQALFSNVDFRDPKTLHGMNMPGLKVLSESKDKFSVRYEDLADGARLTFASKDATVVKAIHMWFDAQLRDHGSDAKSKE
ncbi:MAG: hypothetical protein P8Y60_02955 [Calditrichota bacterium]|jgi:hypothetical protein